MNHAAEHEGTGGPDACGTDQAAHPAPPSRSARPYRRSAVGDILIIIDFVA
ncbi:hypothetical protein SUDANB23_06697 (plasmid) [Streptomyces sp. enrichment culture]